MARWTLDTTIENSATRQHQKPHHHITSQLYKKECICITVTCEYGLLYEWLLWAGCSTLYMYIHSNNIVAMEMQVNDHLMRMGMRFSLCSLATTQHVLSVLGECVRERGRGGEGRRGSASTHSACSLSHITTTNLKLSTSSRNDVLSNSLSRFSLWVSEDTPHQWTHPLNMHVW